MPELRPLFQIRLQVPAIVDLGDTPYGRRKIAAVTGGSFEGDRLRGEVVAPPGGDWLLERHDGVLMLDVRIVLRTHDAQLIYMSYRGMRHGPAETMARLARGEPVDPGEYYFRVTPLFETASPTYDWINKLVAVGIGRRVPQGPVYDVYELL